MEYILAKLSKEMTGQHKDYVKKAKNFKESVTETAIRVKKGNVNKIKTILDKDGTIWNDMADFGKTHVILYFDDPATAKNVMKFDESVTEAKAPTKKLNKVVYKHMEAALKAGPSYHDDRDGSIYGYESALKKMVATAVKEIAGTLSESVEVTEAGIEPMMQPGANNVVVAYSSLTNKDIAQWRKDIKEFNTLFRDAYSVDAVLNATKVAKNSMSKWEKKFKKSDTR